MGIVYHLQGNILCFSTVGDVEFDDGLAQLQRGFEAAAAASTQTSEVRWHLLFDIRQSTENRQSGEIRSIARTIAEHQSILSGKCAVLVAAPLYFGLARMFAVFMESLGLQTEVFSDREAVARWFDAPEAGQAPS